MPMFKQNSKSLEKKNYKVLERAITKKLKWFESFHISNNILNVILSRNNYYDKDFRLILPSYREIEEEAIKIYKNFKCDISKVCYSLRYENFTRKLEIEPNFCDVELFCCTLHDLYVFGGDSIRIIDTKFCPSSIVAINCQHLELDNTELNNCDRCNIKSNEVKADFSKLNTVGNINIDSEFMMFNNTELKGQNIKLNCDLIDTKNTIFKAEYEFKIKCRYNEIVNGVNADTKSIVYNGHDVTNTEPILKIRLLKNLVEYLKKVKDMVTDDIKKDVEETARIRRETLEEKPITKILNRNNR